jgi:hypothetical protein
MLFGGGGSAHAGVAVIQNALPNFEGNGLRHKIIIEIPSASNHILFIAGT